MGEMSSHDTSPGMEHDLPESFIRLCHLTGLKSNFQMDLLGSKCMPMFMHLGARNTMVFRFSTFLSSKAIYKNVDLTKKQHFCLTFPGKVKMRSNVVKSGMVGFRTFQAFRSSLLRNSITIRRQMRWR